MKNMKAMKGGGKAAMSLLQEIHALHGENINVFFTSLLIAPISHGDTKKSRFFYLSFVSSCLCVIVNVLQVF